MGLPQSCVLLKKIIPNPLIVIIFLLHLHHIKALGKRGGVHNASSFCLQELASCVLRQAYCVNILRKMLIINAFRF